MIDAGRHLQQLIFENACLQQRPLSAIFISDFDLIVLIFKIVWSISAKLHTNDRWSETHQLIYKYLFSHSSVGYFYFRFCLNWSTWLFVLFINFIHIFSNVLHCAYLQIRLMDKVALCVLPENQSVLMLLMIYLMHCSYSTVLCYSDAMH